MGSGWNRCRSPHANTLATPEALDLGRHLRITIESRIGSHDVGRSAMNPAPNRGTWNVQFGEEKAKAKASSITTSRFADRLSDSVVVGASRMEGCHSVHIGPPLRSGSAILKCPVTSERCSCNAPSPECPEAEPCSEASAAECTSTRRVTSSSGMPGRASPLRSLRRSGREKERVRRTRAQADAPPGTLNRSGTGHF
jgi:hypothetical protein